MLFHGRQVYLPMQLLKLSQWRCKHIQIIMIATSYSPASNLGRWGPKFEHAWLHLQLSFTMMYDLNGKVSHSGRIFVLFILPLREWEVLLRRGTDLFQIKEGSWACRLSHASTLCLGTWLPVVLRCWLSSSQTLHILARSRSHWGVLIFAPFILFIWCVRAVQHGVPRILWRWWVRVWVVFLGGSRWWCVRVPVYVAVIPVTLLLPLI